MARVTPEIWKGTKCQLYLTLQCIIPETEKNTRKLLKYLFLVCKQNTFYRSQIFRNLGRCMSRGCSMPKEASNEFWNPYPTAQGEGSLNLLLRVCHYVLWIAKRRELNPQWCFLCVWPVSYLPHAPLEPFSDSEWVLPSAQFCPPCSQVKKAPRKLINYSFLKITFKEKITYPSIVC